MSEAGLIAEQWRAVMRECTRASVDRPSIEAHVDGKYVHMRNEARGRVLCNLGAWVLESTVEAFLTEANRAARDAQAGIEQTARQLEAAPY